MSNETKRDVFEDLVEELANAYIALDGEGIGEDLTNEDKQAYLKDYENALPDDLPVIPEAQSDWIKQCKANDDSLSFALGDETTPIEVAKTFRVWGGYTDKNKDKWIKLQNAFARAWVLGVWRVEETGEIVKLEAEK
ncbi:hypothetical protein Lpp125_00842 [Lacticaseibacillus paracasei subsp. paracasei Lpp125]|uniref:hypothetical protein n=1 Tax=Lacticaseibacillus paracasei TaxID=1597 RepID=UPI000343DB59|nr:hypothetical protein [Lacticaseibacillus paracasei]EPD02461.1 hypothetical protein Lpp125_00842 [Lacticaseibacillus paracasei subsp. paracasei Lpp125]